jgi:gamma-glutamyl hydrolase
VSSSLPHLSVCVCLSPLTRSHRWQRENGAPYEAIDHSPEAILISQYSANFFVQQTRKNFHRFPSDEEEDAHLIFNYRTVRSGPDFVETYYFPNDFF